MNDTDETALNEQKNEVEEMSSDVKVTAGANPLSVLGEALESAAETLAKPRSVAGRYC